MEIKDAHFYDMIVSSGKAQRKSRVFNLRLSEIPGQNGVYQIYYYDCGTTHAFQGKVIENTGEKLLFEIEGGKQFEFKPLKRTRPK